MAYIRKGEHTAMRERLALIAKVHALNLRPRYRESKKVWANWCRQQDWVYNLSNEELKARLERAERLSK